MPLPIPKPVGANLEHQPPLPGLLLLVRLLPPGGPLHPLCLLLPLPLSKLQLVRSHRPLRKLHLEKLDLPLPPPLPIPLSDLPHLLPLPRPRPPLLPNNRPLLHLPLRPPLIPPLQLLHFLRGEHPPLKLLNTRLCPPAVRSPLAQIYPINGLHDPFPVDPLLPLTSLSSGPLGSGEGPERGKALAERLGLGGAGGEGERESAG
ncbi:hypothetical protein CALVIDRAFT_166820 [Calocera viscosa TUFC12733]|uniref:Uncharacterized protein n=1 Tax=Calocera viscosa (strain TUFC12733) TaxID=1330018 RepID=A0A167L4J1_CALVF|nr:hypothetical protein CALVIDRAFT_166820 [Calocera viscosa TUFC12733]